MSRKVAIVTGASSGIGKQIAKNLYRNGVTVYAVARRVSEMNDLDDLGIHTRHLDVTDYDEIDQVVGEIAKEAGHLDILVNNAGFGLFGPAETVDLVEGEYEFKVNVFGVMKMIQAVVPFMREQEHGRIINISSADGRVANLLGSWYVGSKFAIEGISDALRLELSPFGIDVAVIEPGAIRSSWKDTAIGKMVDQESDGPYAEMARKSADFFTLGFKFASEPRVVARMVDRAALSRRPKTRYVGGAGAKQLFLLRKILPDKCLDAFLISLTKCAQRILNKQTAFNR